MNKKKSVTELIEETNKKLDKLIALLLIKSGLTKEEVAKTLMVSGRTIQNWFPVDKIKKGGKSE